MAHQKARTTSSVFDSLLMFRVTTDAVLSADETGDGIEINETATRGASAKIVVPSVSGTTPTATFKILSSDDDATYVEIARSEAVNAVGEYVIGFTTQRKYVRMDIALTGTLPNFGVVEAGVCLPAI